MPVRRDAVLDRLVYPPSRVDPSDRELFDRWRAGDGPAGDRLFERHQGAIAAFFAKRAARTASDLVQQTWLECLKSHENYRGEAAFRTFLFAVAHNVLRHHLRGSKRVELDGPLLEIPISQPSPPSLVQRRSEIQALTVAFRELPQEYRLLLEMTYDEQLDSTEIGELLQVPRAHPPPPRPPPRRHRARHERKRRAPKLHAGNAGPLGAKRSGYGR